MKDIVQFVGFKFVLFEYVFLIVIYFIMKKYKDVGVIFEDGEKDDREVIIL